MRPADLRPLARDVLKRPAGPGLIVASFVIAYALAVLPWSGWGLLARPDFMLLIIVFWVLHEPRVVGQGMAFTLGLLMDVSDSMLLGQHAFAYVVASYGAQELRVRILAFPLGAQTLHVAGIFAVSALMILVTNLLLGADMPGAAIFFSPLLTALAWAPANWALNHPVVRRRRQDEAS